MNRILQRYFKPLRGCHHFSEISNIAEFFVDIIRDLVEHVAALIASHRDHCIY